MRIRATLVAYAGLRVKHRKNPAQWWFEIQATRSLGSSVDDNVISVDMTLNYHQICDGENHEESTLQNTFNLIDWWDNWLD